MLAPRLPLPDGRIAWSDPLGAWAVAGYADVVAALDDGRLSANAGRLEHQPARVPEAHDEASARQHVAHALGERVDWVRERLETVTRETCANTSTLLDLQADLLTPLCERLALELTGISPRARDARDLLDAARQVFLHVNAPQGATKSSRATVILSRRFLTDLPRLRAQPGPDLVSALAAGSVPEHVLLSPVVQLFIGVAGSLPLLLGNALCLLLTDPAARACLPPDGRATAELLRLAGPTECVYRLVLEATDVAGRPCVRGDRIALLLAHANRDPRAFSDPLRFDPEREGPAHLSLGRGVHACLGAPILRAALEVVPGRILDALGELRLDPDAVRWGGSPTIQGAASIPAERV